ncbi:DUF2513 domain-containing protein [Anabaena minutissima FACHB-250]|nr:DUF2513 domain-containing protein [Anabaena minutissima FACHB-250]
MKRDINLIRKIILNIESSQYGFVNNNFQIEGYTREQIAYHCYLLIQGGLAEGITTTSVQSSSPAAVIRNLTWEGHEFADAARNDSIWHQVSKVIKEKGESIAFPIITQLLISEMKKNLGLT